MAQGDNLKSQAHVLTREDRVKAGIRSGEVRREKASMKHALELLLDSPSKNGKTYREMAILGLISGAVKGNANNFRVILETMGELNAAQEDKQAQEITKVEELLAKIKNEAQNDTK